MSAAADFVLDNEGEGQVVHFTGRLTLACIDDLPQRLDALHGDGLVLDLGKIEHMDTVGAWLIHRLTRDRGASVVNPNPDQSMLLEQVAKADQPVKIRPDKTPTFIRMLDQMGAANHGRDAHPARPARLLRRAADRDPGTSSPIRAASASTRSCKGSKWSASMRSASSA